MSSRVCSISLFLLLAVFTGGCQRQSHDRVGPSEAKRRVKDSRGVEVEIPADPRRVATVSDALVEEVMIAFGVQNRMVGIGSTCLVREFRYDYQTSAGEVFSHSGGMNPAYFLNRSMAGLPLFVRPGTEINFESLAALDPDLLILDLGACTLTWRNDERAMKQGLDRLQSLGIPTIVLKGANSGGPKGIEATSSEIRILGEVFGKQQQAARLSKYLEESTRLVYDRTRTIAPADRRSVLLLGLNPRLRAGNVIGQASGTADVQSFFIEEIVHARNVYRPEASAILSLEQILAIDPDVIVLPTSNGYHPPRELYEGPSLAPLQHLRAVVNRRAASLPWSPCNCDKRLEYPVDISVIGWTVYPDRFKDLDLADWILGFYQNVYSVDRQTAAGLLHAQWLDWTLPGESAPR
jgi:iron complex transport system substrate-binding protein